ncbi:hypothetical protein [Clostridium baratii]|uniref:hypothetical protein n=1 Tax=Clostridium baratii TaxID=1561 RepID=UPI0029000013|nr:hypothetical protein [Clostridium baratii]MDU1053429.1 hypothetical protein [Clostridium baratii]
MKNIIDLLFKEREEQRNGKDLYPGFKLEPRDPRAIAMLNTLYSKVQKAIRYDYKPKETDIRDEVIQEICLGLCEFTPKFASKAGITIEEIGQALKEEKNILAAKYWAYIKKTVSGAIKDKYKIINPDEEEKEEIEEVLFMDLIKGNLSEEEIADHLNTKNNEYENGATSFSFNKWLEDNKENILTKAQLKFLAANGEGYSDQQKYQFRNNMEKRLLEALNKEFSTTNLKKIELMKQIEVFDDILQSTNFINSLKANLDAHCIMDAIYSKQFKFEELKEITAVYNNVSSKLNSNLLIKLAIVLDIKRSRLIEKVNNM